jgi:alpha/beta superfamily hydrolase
MQRVSIPVPRRYRNNNLLYGENEDTIELEGLLRLRPQAQRPECGVLILHPYSLLGGSMRDPIVTEVLRQAQTNRFFGGVMAYNMRGVGASEGNTLFQTRLGNPFTNQDDARDVSRVIDYFVDRIQSTTQGGHESDIVLVGYSNGAALAAQAVALHPRVVAYVGISPPLGRLASAFLNTKSHCQGMLYPKSKIVPRLLVIGEHDQYTACAELENMVTLHGSSAVLEHGPDDVVQRSIRVTQRIDGENREGCLELQMYRGNDHFWASDGACMVERSLAWLIAELSSD